MSFAEFMHERRDTEFNTYATPISPIDLISNLEQNVVILALQVQSLTNVPMGPEVSIEGDLWEMTRWNYNGSMENWKVLSMGG